MSVRHRERAGQGNELSADSQAGHTPIPDKLTGIQQLQGSKLYASRNDAAAAAARPQDGAEHVRQQAGMTLELAQRAARRAYGADSAGRIQNIRLIGQGFDVIVPRLVTPPVVP